MSRLVTKQTKWHFVGFVMRRLKCVFNLFRYEAVVVFGIRRPQPAYRLGADRSSYQLLPQCHASPLPAAAERGRLLRAGMANGKILTKTHLSHIMRSWYFSSSVNSFFKSACAAILWNQMSDFWSDPSLTSMLHVCEQRMSESSLVAYVKNTIIS